MSWWRGEGDATDEAGGNNGTLLGNTTYGPGMVGQGFVFDGNGDGVSLGNPANLQLQTFTIEAWVKRASASQVSLDSGGNGAGTFYSYGSGGYGFQIVSDGRLALGQIDYGAVFSTGATISDTGWHHVAVSKSGSTVNFYTDGILNSVVSYNPGFVFTAPLMIGAYGSGLANSFLGAIDELAVYNRVLTTNEIQAIYMAGSAGKCGIPPSVIFAGPVTNAANGHWYYMLTLTNWASAEAEAVSLGGHLATINDSSENNFVFTTFAGLIGAPYGLWLGLSDAASEGVWVWSSGEGAVYRNWAPGEPNNFGGNEDYVVMRVPTVTYGGQWNDVAGTEQHYGVVEVSPPAPPSPILAGPITNAANGHWYYMIVSNTWDGAEAEAVALGGHLVTINDAAENAWVYDTFRGVGGIARPFWIGLNDVAVEGTFVWVSGETAAYRNWMPGEPNNGGGVYPPENHVVMRPGLSYPDAWNDCPDADVYVAVVEVSPPPVSSCVAAPSGLVSWWRAEGNAWDDAGGNNGTLVGNTTYGAGVVGQGFVFDGNGDGVSLGNPVNLQLQTFTIEAWVKRASASLASLDSGGNGAGTFYSYGNGGYGFQIAPAGQLTLGQIGYSAIFSTGATISDTNWHHVAVSKSGSTVTFYTDGTLNSVVSYNPGFVFTAPLMIGAWGSGLANSFLGAIDELAVYNRVLTTNEIRALYYAGTAGKCLIPPAIVSQPVSQTVPVGSNVTFSVVSTGSTPLSFQWLFDATNLIAGATNRSLTLTNVQLTNTGDYTVVVSNTLNTTSSAPARLSVRYVVVFGNGQNLTNAQYTFIGPVTIQLQTFYPNGSLFYTLDGSEPSFLSPEYTGPFVVGSSAVLRVLTYSADFLQSWELAPITLNIISLYTLAAGTPGGGTVSVVPPAGPYVSNTVVQVTANPASGWTFLGWWGDATGTDLTVNVTMNRNRAVQARFGTMLNATVAGSGAVVLLPPGGFYPYGTVVELYGVPQADNYFVLWGNAGGGNSNPLSFMLTNANPTVSSLFAPLSAGQYTLTALPDGLGQVVVDPAATTYVGSQGVTLTALPDAGQQFLGWSGDAAGTNNPLSITMDQSKAIVAQFTRRPRLDVRGDLNGLNDQGFRLTLTGEFGARYRIDGSTNLLDWTALLTVTNAHGAEQILDPSAASRPYNFYKAELVP